MTRTINGIDEMKTLVGEHLGWSPYTEITQEQVQKFAEATGDHQWIHIDVERSYSWPIRCPRSLTVTSLCRSAQSSRRRCSGSRASRWASTTVLGKIRFPSPVPVGSNIRLGITLVSVDDIAGGAQVTQEFVFECEGAAKPSCVAEVIFRYYV